jgi:pyridoxine 5-phosphate synthase
MFNLEMSIAGEIVAIARRIRPDQATLVPEKRMEITTEGGLDVRKAGRRLKRAISELQRNGIDVSIFVDPVKPQIDASLEYGATIIELHTGEYANAASGRERLKQLKILEKSAAYAKSLGLVVNAGHGLNYDNVRDVAAIKGLNELNIGHSIVARAVFSGLGAAVEEMLGLIR